MNKDGVPGFLYHVKNQKYWPTEPGKMDIARYITSAETFTRRHGAAKGEIVYKDPSDVSQLGNHYKIINFDPDPEKESYLMDKMRDLKALTLRAGLKFTYDHTVPLIQTCCLREIKTLLALAANQTTDPHTNEPYDALVERSWMRWLAFVDNLKGKLQVGCILPEGSHNHGTLCELFKGASDPLWVAADEKKRNEKQEQHDRAAAAATPAVKAGVNLGGFR